MRVDNFNPNSPNSCVSVCVSVAESCNSPNSLGASHTRELAKCRASDYSRQMPNLNLMPDPIILGPSATRVQAAVVVAGLLAVVVVAVAVVASLLGVRHLAHLRNI